MNVEVEDKKIHEKVLKQFHLFLTRKSLENQDEVLCLKQ